MKLFDSMKTINACHALMKNLDDKQKDEFMALIRKLFDQKQISDEGEFDTFFITEKDVNRIYDKTYGQES